MRITLINFHEAEGSCKSHRTLAGKRIDAIHAGTTIETGALSAFIDVVLTVGSLKPRLTLACVAVDIVSTCASIPAWFTQTFVGISLTFISMKTR